MNNNNQQENIFGSLSKDTFEKGNDSSYMKKFSKGLSKELVLAISKDKDEPKWLLDKRLEALEIFYKMPNPDYGPNLSDLNFDEICFFAKASDKKNSKSWEEVDPKIKETFEKLKIPQAERAMLAGVGAQYESENIYHSIKKEWEDLGVIFEDFDVAVKKHEALVKKYFGKCISPNLHKYSALHYAVLSGGTFLYIPKGVKIDAPLQAYFRMNAEAMGQFEHTLMIIDDNSSGSYIEGCSAPKYGTNALHAGAVEIFVGENSTFRYSSVENWSKDTYNLNTKRAIVNKNSRMEWIGGQMGSKITMLYPCSVLVGENSSCEHLAIQVAGEGQNQDNGGKIIAIGKNTKGNIISKGISKDGGISTYRGIVDVKKTAENSFFSVQCDALVFGKSTSDTIPKINIENSSSGVNHEAKAGKISEEIIFFLESRGISEEKAKAMIVNGFLNEVVKTLPLEYAVEMNRLIELEMEGSIG